MNKEDECHHPLHDCNCEAPYAPITCNNIRSEKMSVCYSLLAPLLGLDLATKFDFLFIFQSTT